LIEKPTDNSILVYAVHQINEYLNLGLQHLCDKGFPN